MLVRFYATLRETVGSRTIEVPQAEGMSIHDLLRRLIRDFPRLGPQLLDTRGELWPHVHVLVNGRDAPRLSSRLETLLEPADAVDIFPPTAGGS
jgi:sulfur-carrier protein